MKFTKFSCNVLSDVKQFLRVLRLPRDRNSNLQQQQTVSRTYQLSSLVITDRIGEGGNAIASVLLSVRLSVRPSLRLFPLYLLNRLTVDFELLH